MVKKTLTWMAVLENPADAPKVFGKNTAASKAWDAYIAKRKEAQALKATFETAFISKAREAGSIKTDETLRFGYNFGKLVVAKDTVTKSTKLDKFTL